MDKHITFSDPSEAIQEARHIFAEYPEVDWVIATGALTVGGVYWEGAHGDLVLHRSEFGMWTGSLTIEECKSQILEHLAKQEAKS